MKQIITTKPDKCVGCNRCIRVCPLEDANIAYEENSKMVVKIDHTKCIACGACIAACPHGSRDYADDTEQFIRDLQNGVHISVFAAPAFKTNCHDWERILTWLRSLGVRKVYDVSLGADICTWAHIRYLQSNPKSQLITQPCPAIVNYILKYQTALIPRLSPVHSPMLCTAIYMRNYEKVGTKIAAISPCVSKTSEFEATGIVEYNVTLARLLEYLESHNIRLPAEPSGFDHYDSGLGFLYPMPGGLKENVEYYLGKNIRIDKSEGQHTVYAALDEYARQSADKLPVLFDVLNCAEGCNHGTGCVSENKSIFEMMTVLDKARRNAVSGGGKEYLEELYARFDDELNLKDFIRRYTAAPVNQVRVSEQKLESAFEMLGKSDEESRHFDCGACGSETCHDMARKIAKGVNSPANCLDKAHRDLTREHTLSLEIQNSNLRNLNKIVTDTENVKTIIENIVANMSGVTAAVDGFKKMNSNIEKIALQISIIAINASIEASRAGKFGQAFGVVADEIRNLANSSSAAVKESTVSSADATTSITAIQKMIEEVSSSINEYCENVNIISENTKKIFEKEEVSHYANLH